MMALHELTRMCLLLNDLDRVAWKDRDYQFLLIIQELEGHWT